MHTPIELTRAATKWSAWPRAAVKTAREITPVGRGLISLYPAIFIHIHIPIQYPYIHRAYEGGDKV